MFWLHLNDHWWVFFNFRWFYFKKGNHVCLKENAVPICPDTELSWCRTVFFNGCRNVLVPNCLVSLNKITYLVQLIFFNYYQCVTLFPTEQSQGRTRFLTSTRSVFISFQSQRQAVTWFLTFTQTELQSDAQTRVDRYAKVFLKRKWRCIWIILQRVFVWRCCVVCFKSIFSFGDWFPPTIIIIHQSCIVLPVSYFP